MRRQDELDGSLYRTLDIQFHEIVVFFLSRVRRQDELNGSFYRTLNDQRHENVVVFGVQSAQTGWTGWILQPHFECQISWNSMILINNIIENLLFSKSERRKLMFYV